MSRSENMVSGWAIRRKNDNRFWADYDDDGIGFWGHLRDASLTWKKSDVEESLKDHSIPLPIPTPEMDIVFVVRTSVIVEDISLYSHLITKIAP